MWFNLYFYSYIFSWIKYLRIQEYGDKNSAEKGSKANNIHTLLFPILTHLTLSWWRTLSYRNQSIHLLCKSMHWFLYDRGLRHKRAKTNLSIIYTPVLVQYYGNPFDPFHANFPFILVLSSILQQILKNTESFEIKGNISTK